MDPLETGSATGFRPVAVDLSRSLHRLRRRRLERALMRPETAGIIAVTMLAAVAVALFGRGWVPWQGAPWAILAGGTLAVLVLVVADLTDPAARVAALREAWNERLEPDRLADRDVRAHVAQAIDHRLRMESVAMVGNRVPRAFVVETLARVDTWLTGIGTLARLLDDLKGRAALDPRARMPLLDRVRDLEDRMRLATDKRVLEQLRSTLAGRRHQLRMIEDLDSLAEAAFLRLERAVATLGAIEAQIAIAGFQNGEQQRAGRIVQEIDDETRDLNATLAALDRVYTLTATAPEEEGIGAIDGGEGITAEQPLGDRLPFKPTTAGRGSIARGP